MAEIAEILNGSRVELCENVPWEKYKALVAMNPSTLTAGLKPGGGTSMLDLKYAWDHERPDTDGMQWGRAVHCLCFEPREFANRYTFWEGRRAGNDYKDFKIDAWVAGQEVLSEKQWQTAQDAALAFVKHPRIQPIISAGKSEVTVFGVEEGMQSRGRVDWVASPNVPVDWDCPHGILADLKTSADVHQRAFGRIFYKFHYDVKQGLYQRWIKAATGVQLPVVVMCLRGAPPNWEPPYDVTDFLVPQAVLDRGVEKALKAFRQLKEAIATDCWPGVARNEAYLLDTPVWEMEEELVEYEG